MSQNEPDQLPVLVADGGRTRFETDVGKHGDGNLRHLPCGPCSFARFAPLIAPRGDAASTAAIGTGTSTRFKASKSSRKSRA